MNIRQSPATFLAALLASLPLALHAANDISKINSSVREGNSNTFVQFEIGTPTDRAVNDVRDAIAQIRGSSAPLGATSPCTSAYMPCPAEAAQPPAMNAKMTMNTESGTQSRTPGGTRPHATTGASPVAMTLRAISTL